MFDLGQVHERNRTDTSRSANRYLKCIRYGNRSPVFSAPGTAPLVEPNEWLFELIFDYGEHDITAPTPEEINSWPCRPDPFSSYRAGFEV